MSTAIHAYKIEKKYLVAINTGDMSRQTDDLSAVLLKAGKRKQTECVDMLHVFLKKILKCCFFRNRNCDVYLWMLRKAEIEF